MIYMFGYRITKDKDVLEAIDTLEELKGLFNVLKKDVANKLCQKELCKDYALSQKECNHFKIFRGSYVSAILSLYKIKHND